MELRPNSEGVWYVLGVPMEDSSKFLQVVLAPNEVEGLPLGVRVDGFENLDEARRMQEIVRLWSDRPVAIYEVRVRRLDS